MSNPKLDLIGLPFNRLLVLNYDHTDKKGNAYWLCKCECGNEKVIRGSHLRLGNVQSCGCWRVDIARKEHTVHGLKNSRFYMVWKHLINRCHNTNNPQYQDYGARGITVCDEWKSNPKGLKAFITWCEEQNPPEGYTIDRRENNLGYSPDNCRFITLGDQQKNKRNNKWIFYNGENLIQEDFLRKYSIVDPKTARQRMVRGWDPIRAALTPKIYDGPSSYN